MREVVVIGAGIAGLVAARAAAAAGGCHVTLVAPAGDGQVQRGRLRPVGPVVSGPVGPGPVVPGPGRSEASAGTAVGGTIPAPGTPGAWVELGAEGFATRGGVMADYLAELGLAGAILDPAPHPTRVYRRGGLLPIPTAAVLGIPADLSDPLLARSIGAGAVRLARELDAEPLPDPLPGAPGVLGTLGDLVRRRMGPAVAERCVAPLVAGVLGRDADRTPAEDLVPGLTAHLRAAGSLAGAIGRIRAERAGTAARVGRSERDGPSGGTAPSGPSGPNGLSGPSGPGEEGGPGATAGNGELAGLAGGMSVLAIRLRAECHRLGVRRVYTRVTAIGGAGIDGAGIDGAGVDGAGIGGTMSIEGTERSAGGFRLRLEGGRVLRAARVVAAAPVPGLGEWPAVRHRQVLVLAGDLSGPTDRGGIILPDDLPGDVPGDRPNGQPGDRPGTRLTAVTFTSAKWGGSSPWGEVVRLTYSGHRPRTPEHGRADLRELGYVVHTRAWAHRAWRLPIARPATDTPEPPGIRLTGAHVLGPGLARIVAHARAAGEEASA
ncbi:hypothetical protein [Pseudactinotalea sp. HY158]|uniref:hypothetical protein n=1 Tax=Pseudactinotalea sp. HY158 TaxID=2654547 RepID=UPI00129C9C81|nr:hypothetical protein [Pseudactinotalea sp. HY158]QGH69719.1 hypothetical protein GCE65_09490 [Pseudactinotalea sp. HY158]